MNLNPFKKSATNKSAGPDGHGQQPPVHSIFTQESADLNNVNRALLNHTKPIIRDIQELSHVTLSQDLDAIRLMALDRKQQSCFIISSDDELYVVDNPDSDERMLFQNVYRHLKVNRKIPPSEQVKHVVLRTVLESLILRLTEELDEDARGAQVERCETIFLRAAELGATDIHIDIRHRTCKVHYRCHGILLRGEQFAATIGEAITNAIWETYVSDSLSGEIAKDGRFERTIDDTQWLFRVSTAISGPTSTKSTAIRLRNMHDIPKLDELGYSDRHLELMHECLGNSGLILICGSVNSGKSTLQSALMHLRPDDQFNFEISDQVEVRLPNFSQIQKPIRGDKSYLAEHLPRLYKLPTRHDVDFIAINEIRDLETAAMTEDLMQLGTPGISSIHAKGWPEAINRLLSPKMGVSRQSLLAEGFFNAIAYQTLGRCLCEHCKLSQHPDPRTDRYYRNQLGDIPLAFRNKEGCEHCGAGVTGLTAICEFIPITDSNRPLLHDTTKSYDMRLWMRENDVPNIHQHALQKVKQGLIDPDTVRPKIGSFTARNIFDEYRGNP